jgi:hypothetical protein
MIVHACGVMGLLGVRPSNSASEEFSARRMNFQTRRGAVRIESCARSAVVTTVPTRVLTKDLQGEAKEGTGRKHSCTELLISHMLRVFW